MVTPLAAADMEPLPYGLVNPKTLVNETERWEGGFEQESLYCNSDIDLFDVCNSNATVNVRTSEGITSLGPYNPFAVQAKVRCSTMGKTEDWVARAQMALDACTSKAVEHEFWTGKLAQDAVADDPNYPNKWLSDGFTDVTPTPGTAVKVRFGLALLEGALADAGCGTRGFIHVPTSVGSVLPVKDKDGDGVLQTTLGNYVIAGAGYDGTGPGVTNPSLGEPVWIYATGPVYVRLGEGVVDAPDQRQHIDTRTNTIEVRASRLAAAQWDGCAHFGVLVDLSLDYA